MRKTVPFDNSFLYATAEVGSAVTDRPDAVELIEGETVSHVSLVRVNAGGLVIYLDIATARSLASQIMRVTNDGDLLWDTEPMTGEEVDLLTDDVKHLHSLSAGAIGGDPA